MESFKTSLLDLGFKIESDQFHNIMNMYNWIGYRRIVTDHRHCECNDKKLQLSVKPFSTTIHGNEYESCEVEVVGEYNGIWYKVMAYSMSPSEFLNRINEIEHNLIMAWEHLKSN